MYHGGQLPNRARRAPGFGEAVMSRMHFAQFAFCGVPRQGIEPRLFQTEVRRPNHWATTGRFVAVDFWWYRSDADDGL